MNKKAKFLVISLVALTMLLVSCGPTTIVTPTTDPNLVYTAAASTASVRLTQIFQSTPSATVGAPATPTTDAASMATSAAKTVAAILTQTAAVTPVAQGTPTPTTAPTNAPSSDRAVYVADVTIPDNTVIAPGAAFVKTWKIQNNGLTTWTTSYTLEFISGEKMSESSSVPLTQSVAPGAQVDISVNMVAPTTVGTYQGYWKLKNASGQYFNDAVYVLIKVGSGGANATPTSAGTPANTPVTTPGNLFSSLTMSVDEGTYQGQCPHLYAFAVTFTLSQAATLTYNLEAYSATPGFTFDLPAAQTNSFGAGTYSLSFPLEFTDSGTGWLRFHATSPVDTTSNQVNFDLSCTP